MFDPEEGLAILAECSVVGVGSGNLGSGGAGILGLRTGRTQLVLGQSAPPLTQSYLVNSPRPLAKAPFANECVITGDQVPRLGRRPSTKRARHNAGLEARPSIRPCLYFDLGGRFIVPGGGKEPDYLLAHPGQIKTEADEYLGTDALTLPQNAEKHVLGADAVVAELQSLSQR